MEDRPGSGDVRGARAGGRRIRAEKGITYLVAAGNDNADLARSIRSAYEEVLTVTAEADFNGEPGDGPAPTCRSDVDETAADFSDFAANSADEAHTIEHPVIRLPRVIRSTRPSLAGTTAT